MSLCIVLFWYTFVVISWIFWVLFMVAFTFNNKNRDTWLRGQICFFLALLFTFLFERNRLKYITETFQMHKNCHEQQDNYHLV